MPSAKSASMTGPDPARLAAFGDALDQALRAADITPAVVGAHVGVTDDAIRKWAKGQVEPPPWRVFAVERLLELAPGELSRHLGFVPVGVASVFAAIDADEALSERDRKVVRAAYRAVRS